MNFRTLVAAFNETELYALRDALDERLMVLVTAATSEDINDEEKCIARESKIGAIKAYRARTGCSLMNAKLVVERHTGSDS